MKYEMGQGTVGPEACLTLGADWAGKGKGAGSITMASSYCTISSLGHPGQPQSEGLSMQGEAGMDLNGPLGDGASLTLGSLLSLEPTGHCQPPYQPFGSETAHTPAAPAREQSGGWESLSDRFPKPGPTDGLVSRRQPGLVLSEVTRSPRLSYGLAPASELTRPRCGHLPSWTEEPSLQEQPRDSFSSSVSWMMSSKAPMGLSEAACAGLLAREKREPSVGGGDLGGPFSRLLGLPVYSICHPQGAAALARGRGGPNRTSANQRSSSPEGHGPLELPWAWATGNAHRAQGSPALPHGRTTGRAGPCWRLRECRGPSWSALRPPAPEQGTPRPRPGTLT